MPDGPDSLTDLYNLSTNRPVALLTGGPAGQTPLLLIYPLLPTQAPHTSCVQAHMVGYSCSSFTHSITWSTHSHHTHLHLSFTHGLLCRSTSCGCSPHPWMLRPASAVPPAAGQASVPRCPSRTWSLQLTRWCAQVGCTDASGLSQAWPWITWRHLGAMLFAVWQLCPRDPSLVVQRCVGLLHTDPLAGAAALRNCVTARNAYHIVKATLGGRTDRTCSGAGCCPLQSV
jgi:hypothetical protein